MKTKNIFKALAFALLMPAMMLTTACSSDNDVITNNENINKKGYEIPVTLNATRQGDDATTRATYNPDTRKLEYSTGDQLYVIGNHETAGMYGGALEWKGGIIFSGTITTPNPYEGSGVELLSSSKWARAILLPAGYDNYHYITINNPGFSGHPDATFATSKATAIEQFSNESARGYNNGFALAPQNAILNFTLTGLTPNTEINVKLWNSYYSLVEGNVTTNGSGTATFAIGIDISMCKAPATTVDVDDLYNKGWELRVNNEVMPPLVTSSTPLVAGKIYNITRNASGTPTPAAGQFSVSDTKKVTFSSGNLQATWDGTSWTWHFAENQWDYIGDATTTPTGNGNTSINGNGTVSASNVTVDLFGWVGASSTWTGAAQYGISNSAATNNTDGYGNNASEALKSDWGNTIGSGWFTLSSDEWTYLFNTRTVNGGTGEGKSYTLGQSVNGKLGVVIYPDDYTGSEYAGSDWSTFEAAGCVFLPAAGSRDDQASSQELVYDAGSYGFYWSSSAYTSSVIPAYRVFFSSSSLNPLNLNNRRLGGSVRLVRDVQ